MKSYYLLIALMFLGAFVLSGCIESMIGGAGGFGCSVAPVDNHTRDECFRETAVQAEDPSLCEKVSGAGFTGQNPPKDKCYLQIANETNNVSLCTKMAGGLNSYEPNECYYDIAINTGDISLCDNVPAVGINTQHYGKEYITKSNCLAQAMKSPNYNATMAAKANATNKTAEVTEKTETEETTTTTTTKEEYSHEQPTETEKAMGVEMLPKEWKGTATVGATNVVGISREAEFSVDGKPPWSSVKPDTVLQEGYHIRTGEDSSVVLGWQSSSSLIKMGPESEMTIGASNTELKHFPSLQVMGGTIWYNLKKGLQGGTGSTNVGWSGSEWVDMTTANDVLGIKGTTLVVSYNRTTNTTVVKVIEGNVTSLSLADRKVTNITTGQMMTIDRSGSGSVRTFNVTKETQYWDMIQPNTGQSNGLLLIGAAVVVIALAAVGYFKFVKNKEAKPAKKK